MHQALPVVTWHDAVQFYVVAIASVCFLVDHGGLDRLAVVADADRSVAVVQSVGLQSLVAMSAMLFRIGLLPLVLWQHWIDIFLNLFAGV